MNRKDDAAFGMIKGTHTFLVDNAAAVTAVNIPIMASYQGQVAALIGPIEETSGLTSQPTNGITAAKEQARVVAVRAAVTIARTVYNYAADHLRPDLTKPASPDNPANYAMLELQQSVAPYKSYFLYTLKDEEVIAYLNTILLVASTVTTVTPPAVNPLVVYGFHNDVGEPEDEDYEAGTLTLFEAAITAYTAISVSPRVMIVNKKTQNKKLREFFAQVLSILEKMDNSFELVKAKNLELYDGYKNARKIVGPMTIHTKIGGTVSKITDLELGTSELVENAKITITAEPYTTIRDGQTILVQPGPWAITTDEEGKFAQATPDTSVRYTVKCILPGYEAIIKNDIFVKIGKKTSVDFKLIPIQP